MAEKNLESLRSKIDAIDAELLRLFAARMQCAEEIGAIKRERGLPVRDAEREREKLEQISALAGEELSGSARELFETLMALSRRRQERLRCGLIGKPLGHSFSPAIHAMLGDYEYRLIELEPEELAPFLKSARFDALNVTIPYKKAVLPLCDALTETARRIGSVNTIVRRADNSLWGDNTDYDGFLWMLNQSGVPVSGKKVLVLGSGGASLTVQTALKDAGAGEVVVVSRGGEINYVNLYERHSDAQLLVNATPVGMVPHTGESLVSLERLPRLEAVFDLIYNPAKTRLLLDAEKLGLPAFNGLAMLTAQAAAASERFTGRKVDNNTVNIIFHAIERRMKNVLLIGMPGAGKSTVGAALAKELGRSFEDTDAVIAAEAGCTIPEIFSKEGETGFRRREHAVLAELTKRGGTVIACGGGAVTRPENLDLMRQNSTVVWLRRALDKLPMEGRPLSQQFPAAELYRRREPLYRAAADLVIENDGTVEDAVKMIREAIGL